MLLQLNLSRNHQHFCIVLQHEWDVSWKELNQNSGKLRKLAEMTSPILFAFKSPLIGFYCGKTTLFPVAMTTQWDQPYCKSASGCVWGRLRTDVLTYGSEKPLASMAARWAQRMMPTTRQDFWVLYLREIMMRPRSSRDLSSVLLTWRWNHKRK